MGSNTSTQTQSNEPYKAAQPLLDKGMGDALSLYKNGGLVKPNTMSTVVPFSNQTVQSQNALTGLANANTGTNGLTGQYQSIINNGGYNADQKTALNGIRDTATSGFDPYNNPAFSQVLKTAQEGALFGDQQNASALGRYGSPAQQGVQERNLGNLTAGLVGNEYNNWQNRQTAAQQQLFNAGQTAQGNLGSAYTGAQAPAQTLAGVGAQQEDLYGRTLNDQLRIANETTNAPLANIQALLAAANGAGNYGTQQSTAQGPNNTFSNILGGALGAGSLFQGLF